MCYTVFNKVHNKHVYSIFYLNYYKLIINEFIYYKNIERLEKFEITLTVYD